MTRPVAAASFVAAGRTSKEVSVTIETRPVEAGSNPLPVLSHWIGGRPVEVLPEHTGPVFNPATGEVIARVPRGGKSEVDRAVEAATAAFPAWRDTPLIARSQIFFKFRELAWKHREELAALITKDHGKTFADALVGVTRGIETVEYACGLPVHLSGMNTPNVATGVDTVTLRQPLGVVAAITPFNFPVMVPMWILPIALAAGNAVILKPSSHTPGATQLQAELWKEAGLPDGILNVVYGGREAVAAIVEAPDIKAIQFDGRRALRIRRRHQARQARRRVHQRQERDGGPAGRGPRDDRRRGRGVGLRLGRRALHGPDPAHRGGRHGRQAAAADARTDRQAEGRSRHGAGR